VPAFAARNRSGLFLLPDLSKSRELPARVKWKDGPVPPAGKMPATLWNSPMKGGIGLSAGTPHRRGSDAPLLSTQRASPTVFSPEYFAKHEIFAPEGPTLSGLTAIPQTRDRPAKRPAEISDPSPSGS
jgi:hypothetical protein